MDDAVPLSTLNRRVCDRARATRDPRFDGLFFTGIKSRVEVRRM